MKYFSIFCLIYSGLLAYRSGQKHTPRGGYSWLMGFALAVVIGMVGFAAFGG